MKYQENRFQKIVLVIQNNPGIRFRELMRKSGTPNGTLIHYMDKLERLDTVEIKRSPKECRFFPNSLSDMEQKIIVVLRKKSQRNILILLQKEITSFSDICKATGLAPSTVSPKLKALVEMNMVEYRYKDRLKKFKIKHPEKISEIVKKYQDIIKIAEP
ncbi:MAG TPA: ArsR family transcriptional regulator [Candidatus Bathyarchaeia archaeon]|nr:ArsR family transcriptional regulator [Candidatus Bathyarchaeia archaeon]